MKIVKLIILSVFVSFQLYGQTVHNHTDTTSDFEHSIGLTSSMSDDYYLNYQLSYRLFYKKIGVDLALYPNLGDHWKEYNVGVTFLYEFYSSKKIALLMFQSNQYFYSHYYSDDFAVEFFNNGLGVELDFIIKNDFRLNLMLSGSYGKSYDDKFNKLMPYFGLGFHYKL